MDRGLIVAWEAAGGTHVGRRRKGNEDALRMDDERGIFIVADGMGGHAAGEIASRLAADAAIEVLAHANRDSIAVDEALRSAFNEAHHRIVTCCNEDAATRGMGTTLTVAVLDRTGRVVIGHIGDSRVYLLSRGILRQVTTDHTWVQQEISAGRLSMEASITHPLSHILSRALTADDAAVADVDAAEVEPTDLLLLCSDGLYNMVDDAKIEELLSSDESAAVIVDRLIVTANRRGGADNITAIVVRIG